MQFNPKWSFYLGIAVTIEIAISHGTIAFTNAIPATWIPFVVAWAGILAFGGSTVMTYMAAYSSAQAGPMVTPQSPSAAPPKALIAALAIGLSALALAWAGPAGAATKGAPLTGDPIKDIGNAINKDVPAQSGQSVLNSDPLDKLTDKLLADILADATYASARAHAANNTITMGCWDAWVTLLTSQTAPLKDAAGNVMNKPDPHVITTAELASEILRTLQPDSPISLACAPALQAMQKDVATMVGSVLSGGALGLFKLPIAIP
jgi:hypothetical protein